MQNFIIEIKDIINTSNNIFYDIFLDFNENKYSNNKLCSAKQISYDKYNNILSYNWNDSFKKFKCENNNNLIFATNVINSFNNNEFNLELLINEILKSFENNSNIYEYNENFIVMMQNISDNIKKNIKCIVKSFDENIHFDKNQIKNILIFILLIIKKNHDTNIFYIIEKSYEMIKYLLYNAFHHTKIESKKNISEYVVNFLPEKISSMKDFISTIIDNYYKNLHPIIWAQIIKEILTNIIEKNIDDIDVLQQIIISNIILNSGPFVLKFMQLARPLIKYDVAKQFGLEKLRYPKMLENQYLLFLNKYVNDFNNYDIFFSSSASIGQVFGLIHKKTQTKHIVKIYKPLSIIQSCWEYDMFKTSKDIYANKKYMNYINNMYNSLTNEFNSKNEQINILRFKDYYDQKIYTFNKMDEIINKYMLKTITSDTNFLKKNPWFMLHMSFAEGETIENIVNSNKYDLSKDTIFRSALHRCFDLLIYNFFKTLINNHEYHGDLHSGNIYFNFNDNNESTMTIIDFGTTGKLQFDENLNIIHNIAFAIKNVNYVELYEIFLVLLMALDVDNKDTYININDNNEKFKNELKTISENVKKCVNNDNLKKALDHLNDYIFSINRLKKENPYLYEKKNKSENMYENMSNEINDEILKNLEMQVENAKCEIDMNDKKYYFRQDFSINAILNLIMNNLTENNVNLILILGDYFEIQKGYSLLLNVLTEIKYPLYRMTYVLSQLFTTINIVNFIFNNTSFFTESVKKMFYKRA
jgi:hypothetical protein